MKTGEVQAMAEAFHWGAQSRSVLPSPWQVAHDEAGAMLLVLSWGVDRRAREFPCLVWGMIAAHQTSASRPFTPRHLRHCTARTSVLTSAIMCLVSSPSMSHCRHSLCKLMRTTMRWQLDTSACPGEAIV